MQLISNPIRVHDFVRRLAPVPLVAGMKGIGLEKDGELVAGVLYESFNGHNVWMHVAAAPGRLWATRKFLETCADYPFNQLGCSRVSGYVEASNAASRALCEHLGFTQEATLKGAASDGGDVILYAMWRKDCRYLKDRHG